jgi:hypothetical protein
MAAKNNFYAKIPQDLSSSSEDIAIDVYQGGWDEIKQNIQGKKGFFSKGFPNETKLKEYIASEFPSHRTSLYFVNSASLSQRSCVVTGSELRAAKRARRDEGASASQDEGSRAIEGLRRAVGNLDYEACQSLLLAEGGRADYQLRADDSRQALDFLPEVTDLSDEQKQAAVEISFLFPSAYHKGIEVHLTKDRGAIASITMDSSIIHRFLPDDQRESLRAKTPDAFIDSGHLKKGLHIRHIRSIESLKEKFDKDWVGKSRGEIKTMLGPFTTLKMLAKHISKAYREQMHAQENLFIGSADENGALAFLATKCREFDAQPYDDISYSVPEKHAVVLARRVGRTKAPIAGLDLAKKSITISCNNRQAVYEAAHHDTPQDADLGGLKQPVEIGVDDSGEFAEDDFDIIDQLVANAESAENAAPVKPDSLVSNRGALSAPPAALASSSTFFDRAADRLPGQTGSGSVRSEFLF